MTEAKTYHIPLPWGIEYPFDEESLAIVSNADADDWRIVATCFSDAAEGDQSPASQICLMEMKANAALICRAVNSHDALVEALKNLAALYEDDEGCRNLPQYLAAKAALALAETGP